MSYIQIPPNDSDSLALINAILTSTNIKLDTANTNLTLVNSSLTTINSTINTSNTILSSINTKTPNLGQAVSANSTPVVIASDQTGVPVTQSGTWSVLAAPIQPATSTVTSVPDSATSVQLLAANSSRKGYFIWNDSAATMYLKLGTTASTTSYTMQLTQQQSFVGISPVYTGRVDAIWGSAPGGAARVTELT